MSSVEGRAREGKHKNYDYCIFENQLNEEFISVLDSWLEEEIISGYVVSPEHNKDLWTKKDERKDKTHVAGQPKEPHRHIAVSFVNAVDQERAYYQSEKLYKPEKWVVHQGSDKPYELYEGKGGVRGRINYYLHWKQPEKVLYNEEDLICRGSIVEDTGKVCMNEGVLVEPFDKDEIGHLFLMTCDKDPRPKNSFRRLLETSRNLGWTLYLEDVPITSADFDTEKEEISKESFQLLVYAKDKTTRTRIEEGFDRKMSEKKREKGWKRKEFFKDIKGAVEKIENIDMSYFIELNEETKRMLKNEYYEKLQEFREELEEEEELLF